VTALPHGPLIDRERMRAMAEQYGDLITELIDIFAQTAPDALAALQRGRAAGDDDAMRAAAHSLKGACQNLGAGVMAELCRTIEADPAHADVDRLAELLEPTVAALRAAGR
jgi:HPt (histidine-containing phosphotransfer) domain-containing protein